PPVLATLACGLQLTFWENATTLSSGMLDLLLFAYSVRCLLEYRISKQESWILRAAVVYALGDNGPAPRFSCGDSLASRLELFPASFSIAAVSLPPPGFARLSLPALPS